MQYLEAVAITVLSSFYNTHMRNPKRMKCDSCRKADCEKCIACQDMVMFGGCGKRKQCFGKGTCVGTSSLRTNTPHIVKPTLVPLTSRQAIHKREDKSLFKVHQPPDGLWYCRFCVRNAFKSRDSLRKHCRLHHTDVWRSTERFWQDTEDDATADSIADTRVAECAEVDAHEACAAAVHTTTKAAHNERVTANWRSVTTWHDAQSRNESEADAPNKLKWKQVTAM